MKRTTIQIDISQCHFVFMEYSAKFQVQNTGEIREKLFYIAYN